MNAGTSSRGTKRGINGRTRPSRQSRNVVRHCALGLRVSRRTLKGLLSNRRKVLITSNCDVHNFRAFRISITMTLNAPSNAPCVNSSLIAGIHGRMPEHGANESSSLIYLGVSISCVLGGCLCGHDDSTQDAYNGEASSHADRWAASGGRS